MEAEETVKQLDMKPVGEITAGMTESNNGAASSNQAVQGTLSISYGLEEAGKAQFIVISHPLSANNSRQ